MKVRILKQTYIDGVVRAGDEIDVPELQGLRLWKNNIAIEIASKVKPVSDVKKVTAKELFAQCKELGIEVDKAKLKGITEEERIAILTGLLTPTGEDASSDNEDEDSNSDDEEDKEV